MRVREREVTNSNEEVNDLEVGWYSEEDMGKTLKWSKPLAFKWPWHILLWDILAGVNWKLCLWFVSLPSNLKVSLRTGEAEEEGGWSNRMLPARSKPGQA